MSQGRDDARGGAPDVGWGAEVERQLARGARRGEHARAGLLETVAELTLTIRAALELMVLRGVASRDEVAAAHGAQRAKMKEDAARQQLGLEVNLDPGDKYAARENLLDCAARLPLCKGVCCFMEQPLQEDDLAEGVVRWDHLRPYWIRHRRGGGCFHLGPQGCKIFENRPRICRVYTCELDGRVWLDFAGRVPNSEAIAALLAAAASGEEPTK